MENLKQLLELMLSIEVVRDTLLIYGEEIFEEDEEVLIEVMDDLFPNKAVSASMSIAKKNYLRGNYWKVRVNIIAYLIKKQLTPAINFGRGNNVLQELRDMFASFGFVLTESGYFDFPYDNDAASPVDTGEYVVSTNEAKQKMREMLSPNVAESAINFFHYNYEVFMVDGEKREVLVGDISFSYICYSCKKEMLNDMEADLMEKLFRLVYDNGAAVYSLCDQDTREFIMITPNAYLNDANLYDLRPCSFDNIDTHTAYLVLSYIALLREETRNDG